MTRRPASRRPPKLEAQPERDARRRPAPRERRLSIRAEVVRHRLTGKHDRLGRAELLALSRRLLQGDTRAWLGIDRTAGLDAAAVARVWSTLWGWDDAGEPEATIDPDRTVAGLAAALARLDDVADRGGSIAFATGRPASLLGVHQALARRAASRGASVLSDFQSGPFRSESGAAVRLWWAEEVAVISDGASMLADPGADAWPEMLYTVGPPDLLVSDRAIAGAGAAWGVEVVALADLDAVALGIACAAGLPVTLLPLRESRPPGAYRVLADYFAGGPTADTAVPAPDDPVSSGADSSGIPV